MKDMETETTKSFSIEGILDVSFKKDPTGAGRELDPFFVQTFANPTVTLSYFNRINFYTTKVFPRKVLDASHEYEWRYKGSVIKSSKKDTFAQYTEYRFTTSQAMRLPGLLPPQLPRESSRRIQSEEAAGGGTPVRWRRRSAAPGSLRG